MNDYNELCSAKAVISRNVFVCSNSYSPLSISPYWLVFGERSELELVADDDVGPVKSDPFGLRFVLGMIP